ncbi:MAG: phage tail tape measure protein, partial [Muribaculaceae bacterium]|nr:phage tail tape measure protein [Muribaculaceae bacterium]
NLDRATPRELKKTLKELERGLEKIPRGTAEWRRQAEQIRRVRAEINSVNAAMREQEGAASRLMGWWGKWQDAALAGAAAAAAAVVMAGRSAVKAYAEMQQEEANVRKYTGMTEEQVKALNEEFRHIDTRSSREELNKLAQEAGRLGKQSQEDVLGFVRAADKINVALDDLGSGATLTLSKLAGIFGDEKRLGTEKALLSIGSVINELSQNCSASAPYLAEFASRMGGVGAQAGLTVQQIMAMAAVLDTNNQALEASATAVSQVMVRIYQDPAKYAKVAGIEVKKFSKLVKEDMNAAFLEFLEHLNRAGSMDVLSPMFKDMGENGSRAISALATLAAKVEDVKMQQENANTAFKEATSIDAEFAVQNSTVQAGMEKAQKAIKEICVTLGQELMPIMKYAISSSTLIVKALLLMVRWLKEYRVEIVSAASALAAYGVVMGIFAVKAKVAAAAGALLNGSISLTSKLGPAFRLVMAAITNAVQYFTGGLRVSYAMQQRWSAAMAAMKFTSWIGLVSALAAGVLILAKRFSDSAKEARRLREEQEQYRKSLTDIAARSNEMAAKEKGRLDALYKSTVSVTKAQEERIKAAATLQKMYPDIFGNFSKEDIMLGKAASAYNRLTRSILENARARAASEKMTENWKEALDKRQDLGDARATFKKADAAYSKTEKEYKARLDGAMDSPQRYAALMREYAEIIKPLREQRDAAMNAIGEAKRSLQEIDRANKWLAEQGGFMFAAGTTPESGEPAAPNDGADYVSKGKSKKGPEVAKWFTDRLKALKAARTEAEAQAAALRALGEIDFREQRDRQEKAMSEYLSKVIALYESDYAKASKGRDYREVDNYQQHVKERSELAKKMLERETAERADILARHRDMAIKEAEAEQKAAGAATLGAEAIFRQKRMEAWREYYAGMFALHDEGSEQYYKLSMEWERKLKEDRLEVRAQFLKRLAELERAGEDARPKWLTEYERKVADLLTLAHDAGLDEEQFAAMRKLAREAARRDSGMLPKGSEAAERGKAKEAELKKARQALDAGIISKEEYARKVAEIEKEFAQSMSDVFSGVNDQWIKAMAGVYDAVSGMIAAFSSGSEGQLQSVAAAVQATSGVVMLAMQTASEFQEADQKIREKRINDYYSKEIELAEGNTRKVKQLEKQKEAEIAEMKRRASEKQFAMQVVAAVAQTATNALNAYGSAAAIPVVGHILAPIAAAAAVAAGMLQVAVIKKQQQAAAATGYMTGGYTEPGPRDRVAGVVHAGEWVAPASMVDNPRTGAVIAMLEQARRGNVSPSLSMEAVDRRIMAPAIMAAAISGRPAAYAAPAIAPEPAMQTDSRGRSLPDVISRLADRLEAPIEAVTTVSGRMGTRNALDKYDRFLKNKSPRDRKSDFTR